MEQSTPRNVGNTSRLIADLRENHLADYRERQQPHDSIVFRRIIDEMFGVMCGVMCGFNTTKQRLTVVFDKGMNSPEAIRTIDGHTRVHFITTYSPHFVEELAGTDLKQFAPLVSQGKEEDPVLAFRSRIPLWDQERTVVVTHNPKTARKKRYTLDQKLESVRLTLLEYRRAYREKQPHWRNPEAIRERYLRECERLHIGAQYYRLDFTEGDSCEMSFRKDPYQVGKSEALFGRNVIVTDNHDWTTEEIVTHSLDRYRIEKQFRASKSAAHVDVSPFYHWTDGKIRCHLLCCVIALVALRRTTPARGRSSSRPAPYCSPATSPPSPPSGNGKSPSSSGPP